MVAAVEGYGGLGTDGIADRGRHCSHRDADCLMS